MSEESKETCPILQGQVQTIRSFAAIHNLLVRSSFPSSDFKLVTDCLKFLQELHKATMSAALDHPEADTIPELKAHRESLKEAQDAAPQETV